MEEKNQATNRNKKTPLDIFIRDKLCLKMLFISPFPSRQMRFSFLLRIMMCCEFYYNQLRFEIQVLWSNRENKSERNDKQVPCATLNYCPSSHNAERSHGNVWLSLFSLFPKIFILCWRFLMWTNSLCLFLTFSSLHLVTSWEL